jgi:hypothetical protein
MAVFYVAIDHCSHHVMSGRSDHCLYSRYAVEESVADMHNQGEDHHTPSTEAVRVVAVAHEEAEVHAAPMYSSCCGSRTHMVQGGQLMRDAKDTDPNCDRAPSASHLSTYQMNGATCSHQSSGEDPVSKAYCSNCHNEHVAEERISYVSHHLEDMGMIHMSHGVEAEALYAAGAVGMYMSSDRCLIDSMGSANLMLEAAAEARGIQLACHSSTHALPRVVEATS